MKKDCIHVTDGRQRIISTYVLKDWEFFSDRPIDFCYKREILEKVTCAKCNKLFLNRVTEFQHIREEFFKSND